jgi:SRSO17 transposase
LYVAGLNGEESFWTLDPKTGEPVGRICTFMTGARGTRTIADLVRSWPKKSWQTVRWRAGSKGTMSSRFHAIRVIPAYDGPLKERTEEWLLAEWPEGAKEPERFWISNVPATVPLVDLVRLAKLRWRIERDYEELKDEIGLDHYEGRNWRGFHHHGVLCITAYAFLMAERARLSPPEPLSFLHPVRPPKGFKPRGAATTTRTS